MLWPVKRSERSQKQDRNDQRKDDDLLEVARIERGKGFDASDEECRNRGQRVADKSADDRGDKPFQADQEPGVVVERRDRNDQDSGNRADHGGQ